jgi:hypothetical protein
LKFRIRATSPDDRPGIVTLMRAAGLQIDANASHFHWKYWQERADWPGARSFVVTDDDQIHAHAGIVPGAILWPGGRATTLHLIDWAASPSAVGAGMALLKHLGALRESMIGVGGTSSTRRALPAVGFHPQGEASSYVRVLRPWRILRNQARSSSHWSWKALPKFARNAWRALRAPVIESGPWTCAQVGRADLALLEDVLPRATNGSAVLERSVAGLAYFLDCPIVPVQIHALRKDDRLVGYFILAFAGGQARLADTWVASGDPMQWRGLVQCAIRTALLDDEVVEIVSVASDPALALALAETGFRPRSSDVIQMRRKVKTPGAAPIDPLRFQMLDSDALYLPSAPWS